MKQTKFEKWKQNPPQAEGHTKLSLMKIAKEYELELIGEYHKVNRDCKVQGYCIEEHCKQVWEKTFRALIENTGGPRCKKHVNMSKAEKTRNTNRKLRGVDNVSQDPEVQAKKENTNMERRGVKHTMQDPEVKAKSVATNMEKRGVDNAAKDPEVKAKMAETNRKLYNHDAPCQNPEIQAKSVATNLERRNVPYPMQDPEVKAKAEETTLKNHGVINPTQNRKLLEKSQKAAFRVKDYTLPSGEIVEYQGYENFTWDFLLFNIKMSEKEILSGENIPSIDWVDSKGKKHVYHCDHYIPSENLLIETKSKYTFERDYEKNLLKQRFAKEAGYKHEILIWNGKGELEDILD